MNFNQPLMIFRMFARLLGRVPTRHLWYLFRRLRYEKPHRFGRQIRVNTFFPPYPSLAFDRFCRAVIERRRVPYSTYLAVTGRCPCRCGHCSYAGRADRELSTVAMLDLIKQIKSLGTCTLGLTGGEPLLRDDLEELAAAAGPEMACILFTTGHGLDERRAAGLKRASVACVTIGLESSDPIEHDRVREFTGSFEQVRAAAVVSRAAGLYFAISTVATHEKIARNELERMYDLAAEWDAGEFRVLAPVATGGWRGCGAAMLSPAELRLVAEFHHAYNRRPSGPAIASFAYLESDELFGCGAGFHHLFIDAAGQVCPCDLTPLSFGDTTIEPLPAIWRRMAAYFPGPRRGCLMQVLSRQVGDWPDTLPLPRENSESLCSTRVYGGPLPEGYRRLVKANQKFKP